jgi:hypothetical protein
LEEKPRDLKVNAKESAKITHETDNDDNDFAVFVASKQQHAKMASKKREGSASATWVIDSGATSHVTPHISYFCSYQRLTQPRRIYLADNSYIKGIGTGTVPIEVKVGDINQKIMLQQVLHVPDASSNLLSIGQLTEAGLHTVFDKTGGSIVNRNDKTLAHAIKHGGLYCIHSRIITPNHIKLSIVAQCEYDAESGTDTYVYTAQKVRTSKTDQDTWHRRLAHLNVEKVAEMA